MLTQKLTRTTTAIQLQSHSDVTVPASRMNAYETSFDWRNNFVWYGVIDIVVTAEELAKKTKLFSEALMKFNKKLSIGEYAQSLA